MINSHALLPTELWRIKLLSSKNSPYGIRTRVTAVKRRCLNPLTNGPSSEIFISLTLLLLYQSACTGSNPRAIDPAAIAKLLTCTYYGTEVDL